MTAMNATSKSSTYQELSSYVIAVFPAQKRISVENSSPRSVKGKIQSKMVSFSVSYNIRVCYVTFRGYIT